MIENDDITQESIFVKVKNEELHLRRIHKNGHGQPVFMVHGSIENGKIFYTEKGKGFGPYLARNGFDVFIADLRGRGESKPAINKNSKHGLSEILWEDFPAYIDKIKEIKGDMPQHWVSHSWGGNMFLAYLARKFDSVKLGSMVFFATKRRISIFSFKKWYMIDFSWGILSRLFIAWKGYLPAKEIGFGADNETKKSHRETNKWIYEKQWIDWNDSFDYSAALKQLNLPPILSITGANDHVLGHPTDIKLLLEEIGATDYDFKIIGKETGFKNDYDHINLLTHKNAVDDHYSMILEWMKKYSPVVVQASD